MSTDEIYDMEQPKGKPTEKKYPFVDGDFLVLGPEVIMEKGGRVIAYRGRNYVPQDNGECDCQARYDQLTDGRGIHDASCAVSRHAAKKQELGSTPPLVPRTVDTAMVTCNCPARFTAYRDSVDLHTPECIVSQLQIIKDREQRPFAAMMRDMPLLPDIGSIWSWMVNDVRANIPEVEVTKLTWDGTEWWVTACDNRPRFGGRRVTNNELSRWREAAVLIREN